MKLNADVLYENLHRHLNMECHGKKRKDIFFGRPEFITGQFCKLKSNHLYIALADKLSRHLPF